MALIWRPLQTWGWLCFSKCRPWTITAGSLGFLLVMQVSEFESDPWNIIPEGRAPKHLRWELVMKWRTFLGDKREWGLTRFCMVKGRKWQAGGAWLLCRCSCEALGKTPEHMELLGDGLSLHRRAQSLLCPGAERLYPAKTMAVTPQSCSGGPETQQGHWVKNTFKKYLCNSYNIWFTSVS